MTLTPFFVHDTDGSAFICRRMSVSDVAFFLFQSFVFCFNHVLLLSKYAMFLFLKNIFLLSFVKQNFYFKILLIQYFVYIDILFLYAVFIFLLHKLFSFYLYFVFLLKCFNSLFCIMQSRKLWEAHPCIL